MSTACMRKEYPYYKFVRVPKWTQNKGEVRDRERQAWVVREQLLEELMLINGWMRLKTLYNKNLIENKHF